MKLLAITACFLLGSRLPAADQREQFAQHARKARAAIATNDTTEAKQELRAMLAIDPGNVDALANLGMVEFLSEEYPEASRHFEAALSRSPSLAAARAFLGMCDLRLGKAEEGRKLIAEALPRVRDKTLHIQAGLDLVRSYSEATKGDEAEALLKQLAGFDPQNPEVLYALYRLHSELSSAALHRLAMLNPDSAWVHEVLGQNYMAQEKYSEAIREFRSAIERGPRLSGLRFQLGEALFAAERTEKNRSLAEKEFLEELQLNPGDAGSLCKLGEIEMERSNLGRAKSFFARAIAARSESDEAHAGMGRIFEQEGNAQGAIRELEEAARLAPDKKTTHYKLARLYRAQGRIADADRELALFRRLADSEPGN